jgi:uncharacterized protein YjdB
MSKYLYTAIIFLISYCSFSHEALAQSSACYPFQITTKDSVLCLGKSTTLFTPVRDSLSSPRTINYQHPSMMFNVVGKLPVTINGIDFDVLNVPVASTDSVAIYYKRGSFLGYETAASSWTLIGNSPIVKVGSPLTSRAATIPDTFSININAGDTIAFYVSRSGSTSNLLVGNPVTSLNNIVVQDSNLQMLQGSPALYPFIYWGTAAYTFLGQIHYKKFDVLWSTAATSDSITVSPTATTSYWARLTNWTGCSTTDTIQVQINSLPTISGTLSACVGQTSTLTGSASPDATTPWTSSNTGVATVSSTGVVTGVLAGTTTITYKNTNGCTQTATFTVNALPTISGTLSACVGQTSTLTGSASPDATTPWTSSNTGVATISSTGVVTGVSGGTTTITYKNTNGCTQTAPFTVNALPTISGTLSACVGQTSTLTGSASPDATTPWTSSNTGVATISSTGVVTGVSGGTTTITYKNTNGCTQTASFTVNALPAVPTVVTPLNLCIGSAAVPLTATGTNLKWYTVASGGTSASSVTPNTATLGSTSYYVSQTTAASAGGCEGPRSTLVVIVNPLPAAPTVVSPVQLCLGDVPTALTATGTNLLWYTAAAGGIGSSTAPIPPTSALASTTYYVSQTTAASVGSCEGSRSALVVNVNPLPVVSINPVGAPDFAYCHHDSITIQATAPTATSLQWSRNLIAIPSATTSTLRIGSNGLYGMTAKDMYGCTTLKTVNVFEDTLPHSTLSPTNIQICEGVTVTLYCNPATTGYKYQWFQNAIPMTTPLTSSTSIVGATAAYKVRVTDIYGCVDTTNISNLSTYTSVVKPTILRFDPLLKVNNVYSYYQWYRNKNAILGANGLTYTMLFDGSYYVEVSDENGCTKYSDTVIVEQLGINNTQSQQMDLQVYPNPSQGKVNIECSINVNISVTDMAGRLLLQKAHVKEIDLSEFADGVYLFHITNDDGMQLSVEKINKLSAQH